MQYKAVRRVGLSNPPFRYRQIYLAGLFLDYFKLLVIAIC